MGRPDDLFRVAPYVRAMCGQHVALAREQVRRTAGEVPVLGVPSGDAQCPLFAAAADTDRRMRPLRALGLVAGSLEVVVLALEVGGLLAEQADQHLTGFFEPVEAFLDGAQLDAVGARLLLVPPPADPQPQPPIGNV